jgi:NAD(P)-dependent dehydrogenase (short-subunit alcohol dehydrogenase family)
MPERAAIVTGASSGIGLAIAHTLGEEGYGLTVAARRPEKLAAAAEELRAAGFDVAEVAANLADEEDIRRVVAAHRDRYGRLDVLVNSAGAEHRNALVVNLSSISGKSGQPWLAVYSATKAAVIGYTQAMNKELAGDGVKSVALAPGFVDTPMTDFVKESVAPEEMIRTSDIAEAVRFLLRTSPACVVPEIVFQRPGEAL